MPADLAERLKFAEEVARSAGEIVLRYFRTGALDSRAKGSRDLVTEADLASETYLLEEIRRYFPNDGILAEEGGRAEDRTGYRWCIDPLDGTLNFSRGLPLWCVSIALFHEGRPVLGVLRDPQRDETYRGCEGGGAWLNEARLTTSARTEPEQSVVHLTVDFDDRATHALDDLVQVAPHVLRTRNFGSAALALGYVAAGWLDAMLHRSANPWDYGAGVLLIREAGGAVTALDGSPYRLETRSMAAAATEELRGKLVDIIGENTARGLE